MRPPIAIHWFRQDLRIADNPALHAAVRSNNVLPIFILDDDTCHDWTRGAASQWWLHHSLKALNQSIDGSLCLYKGQPEDVLLELHKRFNIRSIYWNRCYEPWRIQQDAIIKQRLQALGVATKSYNGSLLWEPWAIHKKDGSPYQVFTPFFMNGCLKAPMPHKPVPAPHQPTWIHDPKCSLRLEQLNLRPKTRWDQQLEPHWSIGENGAQSQLDTFITEGLDHYKMGRDLPAKPYTSRLSPHLHFGEISPHQIWHKIAEMGEDLNTDHFRRELGWREFSYSQLFHHPTLPTDNLQKKFDQFPWAHDLQNLKAWQHGQTGIPMVDAGMRELWQTGYMHNRVRMIVGSFLVKNLRLHWHHGARWFWDCLVDADLASNSASWQWVAGCGADAAPYFRIFNPVIQGQKFDASGVYIKKYLPELKNLDTPYLFSPWSAPLSALTKAGVILGQTYPKPIVDLKQSRQEALAALASIK